MKRPIENDFVDDEMEGEDDGPLQQALLASLIVGEEEEDEYAGDDDVTDEELQIALDRSVTFEKEQAERKVRLDLLYGEMRKNADRTQMRSTAASNSAYNERYPTALSTDVILLRILDELCVLSMSHLYCVSKEVRKLMASLVLSNSMNSVEIPLNINFPPFALQPPFWKGQYFHAIAECVDTLRIRIRLEERVTYYRPIKYTIGHTIKHIIVSVSDKRDVEWFRRSFHLHGIDVIMYHEQGSSFTPYKPRLAVAPDDVRQEIPDAIVDPMGRLFNALPNFATSVKY